MKKWEKPELSTIGIENTYEDISELGLGGEHYCHEMDEFAAHNDNKHTGHYRNEKCDEVHWNEGHVSKCCCAGPSTGIPVS